MPKGNDVYTLFTAEDFIAMPEHHAYFYAGDCLAARANKILASRSTVVYAHRGPSNPDGVWIAKGYHDADSTHTALLVCVTPIVRDTPESLLREYVADVDAWKRGEWRNVDEWVARVRRVLGEAK